MSLKVTVDDIKAWLNPSELKSTDDESSVENLIDGVESPVESTSNSNVMPMAIEFDYAKIAEQYNVSADDVKEKVTELLNKVKELLPDESDDVYHFVVMQKIGEKFIGPAKSGIEYAKEKAEEFGVVILGISQVRDLNEYQKRMAWKAYREDPNAALAQKLVKKTKRENGTDSIVPLDNKREFDNGDPNPNYGNPIEFKGAREMISMVDGDIYLCRGDIGIDHKNWETGEITKASVYPAIGMKSTVWGGKTAVKDKPYKAVIKVWKGAYEDDGSPYKNTWDLAEKLCKSDYYVPLEEVNELPSYGIYVTRGYVKGEVTPNDKGKVYVAINNENDARGIRLSTSYEPIVATTKGLSDGDEVIIIGERGSFKSDETNAEGKPVYKAYNMLMGAFKSSESSAYSDAIKKLNDKLKAL